MKQVLIAIDSFKGSFTSQQAAETVSAVLRPRGFECIGISIADGGEGTAAAYLANHPGGRWESQIVHDPTGKEIVARYAMISETHTVVIDSAEASGLQFVVSEGNFVDPMTTSSFGTGELVAAAIAMGAKTIAIGLGGTGTTDAGIGMLGALGARFFDKAGNKVAPTVVNLGRIMSVDISQLVTRGVHLIACSDVDSPLTGDNGAVKMFGPQKGVAEQSELLEQSFSHFARVIDPQNKGQLAGDGAAGGLGFALRMIGAQSQPGFDFIAEAAGLNAKVAACDLVLTGEGRLDQQSLHGKVPVQLAELANKFNKPCIGLAGSVGLSLAELQPAGFTTAFSIVQKPQSLADAVRDGRKNLATFVERLAPLLNR